MSTECHIIDLTHYIYFLFQIVCIYVSRPKINPRLGTSLASRPKITPRLGTSLASRLFPGILNIRRASKINIEIYKIHIEITGLYIYI